MCRRSSRFYWGWWSGLRCLDCTLGWTSWVAPLDYLSYCSGSVCCCTEEISSELGLTSNWTSTVSFFEMVLVGYWVEAKARSQWHYRSKDWLQQEGWLLFPCHQFSIESRSCSLFRKATLKNSERFGTEELARIEGDMLEAREKSANLEYTIFMRIREEVGKYIQRLQQLAQAIATVDVLQSLASVAESQQLNRPFFHEERRIAIDKGRHPSCRKSWEPSPIFLIASLWMRNGIFSWLQGQIWAGSLPICANWRSLWFLPKLAPMFQRKRPSCQSLMRFYSNRSCWWPGIGSVYLHGGKWWRPITPFARQRPVLILFDELGRGTATYDGMALAQSIIEYIHDRTGAKTLFATHYHELTALSETLSRLENVHVATLGEMVRLPSCTRLNPAQQISL